MQDTKTFIYGGQFSYLLVIIKSCECGMPSIALYVYDICICVHAVNFMHIYVYIYQLIGDRQMLENSSIKLSLVPM